MLKAEDECQHNTGFSDTGFSDTGFSETGLSETGFSKAGFSVTGFSDTGVFFPEAECKKQKASANITQVFQIQVCFFYFFI